MERRAEGVDEAARRIERGLAALLLGVAALVPVGAVLRLQLQPTPAATKLRPFVEVYVVVAQAGLAIALGVTRGVTWRPW